MRDRVFARFHIEESEKRSVSLCFWFFDYPDDQEATSRRIVVRDGDAQRCYQFSDFPNRSFRRRAFPEASLFPQFRKLSCDVISRGITLLWVVFTCIYGAAHISKMIPSSYPLRSASFPIRRSVSSNYPPSAFLARNEEAERTNERTSEWANEVRIRGPSFQVTPRALTFCSLTGRALDKLHLTFRKRYTRELLVPRQSYRVVSAPSRDVSLSLFSLCLLSPPLSFLSLCHSSRSLFLLLTPSFPSHSIPSLFLPLLSPLSLAFPLRLYSSIS